MTTLAPNPHSPHANADPEHRHVFPSPFFFPDPLPGVLALTACERMAVVPEENLAEARPGADNLPEGLCPACVAVMNGSDVPEHPLTDCAECGLKTHHGGVCALCRQDAHEKWWPTREERPACGKCRRPFDPTDQRFDGHAQHADTPWCRRCVNRCHDNESADHRCVICA